LAWFIYTEHPHLVVTEKTKRNNAEFNFSRILVFEVVDGRTKQGEAYESDQYAFDLFWS
jgi:hypothetical protein